MTFIPYLTPRNIQSSQITCLSFNSKLKNGRIYFLKAQFYSTFPQEIIASSGFSILQTLSMVFVHSWPSTYHLQQRQCRSEMRKVCHFRPFHAYSLAIFCTQNSTSNSTINSDICYIPIAGGHCNHSCNQPPPLSGRPSIDDIMAVFHCPDIHGPLHKHGNLPALHGRL